MNTMLIELTHQKAIGLLHHLQDMQLIKVLNENTAAPKTKLSDKFRGIISKKDGEKLQQHIQQMRNEWDNI
jgi:hypothetical protein